MLVKEIKKRIILFIVSIVGTSCTNNNLYFDIEGHRGCRGLAPENTIPAFIRAVEIGVTTLEMDVVISKDSQLIVSHEPWMNPEICCDTIGNRLPVNSKDLLNLYKMDYSEIRKYDCGSLYYPRFSEQLKIKVAKPLLSEVIDTVESYCSKNKISTIQYNIEIKSSPEGDNIYHPIPSIYAKDLIELLRGKGILSRCIIQSFDVRPLIFIHENYPEIQLSLLSDGSTQLSDDLKKLGFNPSYFSPSKEIVTKNLIEFCHNLNIKVVIWTVNDKSEMFKFKELGIDGMITDYPDIAVSLFRAKI